MLSKKEEYATGRTPMTYMMRRRFQGSAPDVTELDRTVDALNL